MSMLKPLELSKATIETGIKKANRPMWLTLLFAFLAGTYISFAGIASTIASHDVTATLGFGIAKSISGVFFSLALILILLAGAELFTGNNLLIMARLSKKISTKALLKNWILVYVGNFFGALLVAWLMFKSGLWGVNGGAAALTAVKIAKAKVSIPFMQALIRGILANWLVCLAVWVATAAKDLVGKLIATVAIIAPFIVSGFEHSIANMYYIPTGIMLKNSSLVSQTFTHLNWSTMINSNLIPVTIGNIIGGAFFVGTMYWIALEHKK